MLENTQSACVITHRHADLDAYACGYAMRELLEGLGIRTRLVVPEGVGAEVKSYSARLGIELSYEDSCGDNDLVVIVDVSTSSQLNELRRYLGGKVLVIDHHSVHNINPTLSLVDSGATSCSEIAALLMMRLGIKPSRNASLLLLGGIISDSNRFLRARVETFEVMRWLLGNVDVGYRDIIGALATEASFSERMALVKGMLRLRAYRLGELITCLSRVNAYESSLADLLIRAGCDIALVASEHDNETRMVGRASRRVGISLAEVFGDVARYFHGEGGGHDKAAALSIGASVDPWTVLIKALNIIEEKLGIKSQRIFESG